MTKNTDTPKLYTPDNNKPVDNIVAALAETPVETVPVCFGDVPVPVCFGDVLKVAAENYLSLPCTSPEHSIARARLSECLTYLKSH